METQTFFLDQYDQQSFEGGYYVRNPLVEFFNKLQAQGLRPVGIVYDGSYNLEILVEKTD